MSDTSRRLRRYPLQKPANDDICQRRGTGCKVSKDPLSEFARLLMLASAYSKEVKAQQAFIRGIISAGNRGSLQGEWNELTNLLLENRMLSRRLRAVFDR